MSSIRSYNFITNKNELNMKDEKKKKRKKKK